MQKTAQLSINAQIGVVLGTLLLFSIIFTVAGFLAADQEKEKLAAFAADGVATTGTITAKRIHVVRGNWVHWLDVEFKSEDGLTHDESTIVANSIYDRLSVGKPVQVTYVKSKPEWFYVPGGEPTERSVGISSGMFKYGILASILCTFGLLGFLFKGLGGRTTAGRTEAVQRPTESSVRRVPRQTRASFGTRQSGS